MVDGAFVSTIGHRSVSCSSSGTYSSVNLALRLAGSYFLPAEVYGGFMHMNILKSGCRLVSTISALSFKRIWSPSIMVLSLLRTESLARLISSSRIQSPLYMLLISAPSMNWNMKPPPESSFSDLFCSSWIIRSSFVDLPWSSWLRRFFRLIL